MRFAFIVNPKAGGGKHIPFDPYLNSFKYSKSSEVFLWHKVDDLPQIIKNVDSKVDVVVSVGGDGTNLSIARELHQKGIPIGFIPVGSGNGLTNHFGISRHIPTALKQLEQATYGQMDVLEVNAKIFINVAGIGFDAEVSKIFASSTSRGLINYVKITLKHVFKFEPFALSFDDHHLNHLMICAIANGSQWGNDFFIAPNAKLDNQKFSLICIKRPKWYQWLGLMRAFILKRLDKHTLVTTHELVSVGLTSDKPLPYHTDGEFMDESQEWKVQVHPKPLEIYV